MLSEEEIQKRYSDDKLEDLYKLYHEVDREVEKAKGRRTWLATGAFFIFPALLVFALAERLEFGQICLFLFLAAVLAVIRFWIFCPVYSWLFRENRADHERRENIIRRIQAAKKRAGYRPSFEEIIAAGIYEGNKLMSYYYSDEDSSEGDPTDGFFENDFPEEDFSKEES